MTRRYLICREHQTPAGIRAEPVTLPGWGSELILHGPNADHVIANARRREWFGAARQCADCGGCNECECCGDCGKAPERCKCRGDEPDSIEVLGLGGVW